MSKRSKLFYEFGPFRLDTTERVLLRDGTPVPLTPKVFELLNVLVENSGHLVEKDKLLEKVWPDTMVEEGSINRNVSTLRKALGEDASEQQYIETVPKRGYRFIAPVRELDEQSAGPIIEGHTSPRLSVKEEIIRSIEPDPAFLKAPLYANRRETTRVRSRPALLILGFFILAAGLAVAIHFATSNRPNEPAQASAFKTTAVLPFKLIGEESGDEYLKLGMADALITKLSNLRQISVRPTSAIRKYVATGQDAVTAAQDLGVESILDGNIQRLGDRIRVTVQLINAHDGLPLWADKVDASFTDIFEVEDSISEKIVKALALKLTRDEQEQLVRRYTESVPAYQVYLQGRSYLVSLTREDTLKAIEAFEKAVALDHDYALAYAGLARASAQMRIRFASELEIKDWADRASQEAQHALSLDPKLAEAHEALAAIYRYTEFDWERTIEESRRALELNPSLDALPTYLAGAFYHLGLLDLVKSEARRAMEINRVNRVEPIRAEGIAAFLGGNWTEAVRLLEGMNRLSDKPLSDIWLAQAYYYNGEHAKAELMLSQMRGSAQVERRAQATVASFLAARGKKREAEALLHHVIGGNYMDHHVAYSVGVTYGQLHAPNQALQWLARAADSGFPCYPWYQKDPLLLPLRGDAAFQRFIAKLQKSWEAAKAKYAS